jgi:hypothetical protein
MAIALMLTNGVVFGFEWSLKSRLFQLHLSFFSIVVLWGLKGEDWEDDREP